MKSQDILVITACLVGCGAETAGVVAEIGWKFDYRDWTLCACDEQTCVDAHPGESCTEDDIRTCDNEPALNPGPLYRSVAKVRVLIEDAEKQVQGLDRRWDCGVGDGGQRANIKGLARQSYELTITAAAADGVKLYELFVKDLDLTSVVTRTYTLPTSTGETHFFPTRNGPAPLDCPSDVETIRYAMFEVDDGMLADAPAVQGSQSACLGDFFDEVYVREVPAQPGKGFGGTLTPTEYLLRVEGLEGGTINYCGEATRFINPGMENANPNVVLNAGPCP